MRNSRKQMKWSRAVRKRDNYICNICLATTDLTTHHLNSKDVRNQYSIDNGITLCATCHQRFHQSHWNIYEGKPSPCTAAQYKRYKSKTIEKYARKQGRAAFHTGLTRADNPYTDTEHYLFFGIARFVLNNSKTHQQNTTRFI